MPETTNNHALDGFEPYLGNRAGDPSSRIPNINTGAPNGRVNKAFAEFVDAHGGAFDLFVDKNARRLAVMPSPEGRYRATKAGLGYRSNGIVPASKAAGLPKGIYTAIVRDGILIFGSDEAEPRSPQGGRG